MGPELVVFLVDALGLYVIYKLFTKAWKWAGIKQKEQDLKLVEEQEKEVQRIKKTVHVDDGTVRKEIEDFTK
jgi:hypothetical protein